MIYSICGAYGSVVTAPKPINDKSGGYQGDPHHVAGPVGDDRDGIMSR